MKIHSKIILFLLLFNVASVTLIVLRYERLIVQVRKDALSFGNVPGGAKQTVNLPADKIVELISGSKEFIGDSITIFEDGTMKTNNTKFQGTLNAVIGSDDNMSIVKSNMITNGLPVQYNIYIIAASYYRQQYPDEFPSTK